LGRPPRATIVIGFSASRTEPLIMNGSAGMLAPRVFHL
jgi:hypothetical protein